MSFQRLLPSRKCAMFLRFSCKQLSISSASVRLAAFVPSWRSQFCCGLGDLCVRGVCGYQNQIRQGNASHMNDLPAKDKCVSGAPRITGRFHAEPPSG